MAKEVSYDLIDNQKGVPIKAWTRGVPFDDKAKEQLLSTASMPFIHKWIAVMPAVYQGYGATISSVTPTSGAIIPATVGVDLGCGIMAVRTTLRAKDLPYHLGNVRSSIEKIIPHGRFKYGGRFDRGAWSSPPPFVYDAWKALKPGFDQIIEKHPKLRQGKQIHHLGTLGSGNHFIEMCLDQNQQVWFMLHSGSRGVGTQIGNYFIEKAKEATLHLDTKLPHSYLSYLPEESDIFQDYIDAVNWAQSYAVTNRELIMDLVIRAVRSTVGIIPFEADLEVINCHHNYVAQEEHFGENVWVCRRGAVRARLGELCIIPGTMGDCSYIVRGRGNEDSFHSCSNGVGRAVSRREAKQRFTTDDHRFSTEGVECQKDKSVLDETPKAFKRIDAVMKAQGDLVEVVQKLKQVVCIKS